VRFSGIRVPPLARTLCVSGCRLNQVDALSFSVCSRSDKWVFAEFINHLASKESFVPEYGKYLRAAQRSSGLVLMHQQEM
jgi:hypothetical protein